MNIRKWIDYIYLDEQLANEVQTILERPLRKQDGSRLLGMLTEHYIRLGASDPSSAKRGYDELLHNVEVLTRLEKALGSWLSFEECVALAHVLNLENFLFEDGFIINDLRDDGMTIGKREAEALASCFHPDPDVKHYELQFAGMTSRRYDHTPLPSDKFELSNLIKDKILKTDGARLVDYKDLSDLSPIIEQLK